jgi:hypothetical protein
MLVLQLSYGILKKSQLHLILESKKYYLLIMT